MSVQYSVTCLDCRAHAPRVGDGGFFGMPSATPEIGGYLYIPDMPTFAYLYDPLKPLGLRTYELEAFDHFLGEHGTHFLYLHSDHDDPSHYPPEVEAKLDELDGEYSYDDFDVEQQRLEDSVAKGTFVGAYYALDCGRCRVAYSTTEPGLFRAFADLRVPADAVDLFLDRFEPLAPDDGWNHRLGPPLDPWGPFLEQLPTFLKRHRGHDLTARLSKEAVPGALTGEALQAESREEQERRERIRRAAHTVWPRGASAITFAEYLVLVLSTWAFLEALPAIVFVATRPSARSIPVVAAFSAALCVPSLIWTLLGARFAWHKFGTSHLATIGKGVSFAVRALALSWACWTLFNAIGPRPPGIWRVTAITVEWFHVWMIPSTIAVGAVAGHVQWRAFYDLLTKVATSSADRDIAD